MTPDPTFLFLTPGYREALAGLTYAILDRKGLVVLIGDAGTGKTTLLKQFLEAVPPDWLKAGVILNPMLTAAEFLEALLLSFGVTEIPDSKPRRLQLLEGLLTEASKAKKVCALLVDEAHKLSLELLEEIRLIGNMELNGEKLLQIVLLGQNDLGDTLKREDLRQLKQRIALRFTIQKLVDTEIEEYMTYRWEKAGASHPLPFSAEAVAAIAAGSEGIPRTINSICDNALMLAFAAGERSVTERHVLDVLKDLDIQIKVPATSRPSVLPAAEESVPALAAAANGLVAGAVEEVARNGRPVSPKNSLSILAVEPEPGVGAPVAVEPSSIRLRGTITTAPKKKRWWLMRLFARDGAAEYENMYE